MLKLENLVKGAQVVGVDPAGPVTIVAADAAGEEAVSLVYKTADGALADRMLFRADEPRLALATISRAWGFDADGADFKLAAEA